MYEFQNLLSLFLSQYQCQFIPNKLPIKSNLKGFIGARFDTYITCLYSMEVMHLFEVSLSSSSKLKTAKCIRTDQHIGQVLIVPNQYTVSSQTTQALCLSRISLSLLFVCSFFSVRNNCNFFWIEKTTGQRGKHTKVSM